MAKNFNRDMEQVISQLKKSGQKPKLLLHSCCAPCSTACIEAVKDYFDLTVFYYNPNIDTLEEYTLRKEEQQRLCEKLGVKCICCDYSKQDFTTAVQGLETEREGGGRCTVCYKLRLTKTAQTAKETGFDYFTTTLTVSPLKDAERLNAIGLELADSLGVKWLPSDFKKKGGYLRSVELSKQFGLYRQNYCGCEFSKNLRP